MAALSSAPLPFPQVVTLVHGAVNAHDGPSLARLFASPLSASTPVERQLPRAILSALTHSSERFLNPLAFRLPEPWREVLVAHVQVLVLIQQAAFADATDADRGSAAELDSWEQAYKTQHALVSAYLTKHLAASTAWSLPVLYVLLRTLRQLATKADALAILSPSPSSSSAPPPSSLSSGSNSSNSSGGGGNGGSGGWVRSEAVARLTMKAFTICATDRSCSIPGSAEARQWGIYALGNQLIKAYFALGRPSLATNLIRAVDNAPSKPPLTAYPKADQVTWRFLMGTLHLLGGQWPKARAELEEAWQLCHHAAVVQQRQLLTVLLPLELVVHGRLPSRTLLAAHPPLQHLYGPFVEAVRKADVGAYDRALERAVGWAVEKRVWAVLERAREVVVRGALRKTWVALGRPNRVSVEAWKCGLRLLGAAGGGGPGAVGGTGPEAAAAAGIESQRRRREEGEAAAAAATAAEVGEEETTTTTTPAAEGWADLGLETAEDVECLLAGMIYKGYVKGYISHGHQVVVLSKQGAFPPLASRVAAGPE